MRIEVNQSCNVRTREGVAPWPHNPSVSADVNIHRFNTSAMPDHAHAIGVDLIEAAHVADQQRVRLEPGKFLRNPRPTYGQLLEFAQLIARMTTSTEADACPEDNALALGALITSARTITGITTTKGETNA